MAHPGPLCVDAKAGCGKSTTAVEAAAMRPPGSMVGMFAYNVSAKADLLKKAKPGVHVQTLNSLGHQMITHHLPKAAFVGASGGRARRVVERVCEQENGRRYRFRAAAEDVVDKARQLLTPITVEGMLSIIRRFSINWVDGIECVSAAIRRDAHEDMARICVSALELLRTELGGFDFADQVWLPHVLDLSRHQAWSHMFVDEAQDLNEGQIQLVRRAARRDTLVTVIGDPYQAIYGFRGADAAAFERLAMEFGCDRLPLTITFRCGKVIVRLARNLVPMFSAADSAPDGSIRDICTSRLINEALPGDFVVSRTNAPLIEYCLDAIRCGKPANILGKDVARDLKSFLKGASFKMGGNPSKKDFMTWLVGWEEAEVDVCIAEKREYDGVLDKTACVRALWQYADTLDQASSVLDRIFVDPSKNVPRKCITLSTTHKVKGLEADTVFVLESTFGAHAKAKQEERNLYYVAITRAKRSLVFANADAAPPWWALQMDGR